MLLVLVAYIPDAALLRSAIRNTFCSGVEESLSCFECVTSKVLWETISYDISDEALTKTYILGSCWCITRNNVDFANRVIQAVKHRIDACREQMLYADVCQNSFVPELRSGKFT